MKSGATDQVRVKVHQMAIRSVWVERMVIVEIPAEFVGQQARIEEIIRSGDLDYGPFLWEPMDGTECLHLMDTAVANQTDEVPDIPADRLYPLEHAEMRGKSA